MTFQAQDEPGSGENSEAEEEEEDNGQDGELLAENGIELTSESDDDQNLEDQQSQQQPVQQLMPQA